MELNEMVNKVILGDCFYLTNIYHMGRRKIDDLNILCRVCNALHYLQLKYGNIPMRVLWKS